MEEKKIVKIKISDIFPNRFQPRIKFDDKAINELAESIREHGVLQPIIVRKVSDKYEIIAGERRHKASVLAGLTEIPSIITDLNDTESAEIALIENVQRQDLSAIEKAISYRRILDMSNLTQEDLAKKIGKSQSTVANSLRLLNLSEKIQDSLLNGEISERHARSLLKINTTKEQEKMLDRIIKERLTVRKLDLEIEKIQNGKAEIATSDELPSLESLFQKKVSAEEAVKMENIPKIEDLAIPSTKIVEPPLPVSVSQNIFEVDKSIQSQNITEKLDFEIPLPSLKPIIETPSIEEQTLANQNQPNHSIFGNIKLEDQPNNPFEQSISFQENNPNPNQTLQQNNGVENSNQFIKTPPVEQQPNQFIQTPIVDQSNQFIQKAVVEQPNQFIQTPQTEQNTYETGMQPGKFFTLNNNEDSGNMQPANPYADLVANNNLNNPINNQQMNTSAEQIVEPVMKIQKPHLLAIKEYRELTNYLKNKGNEIEIEEIDLGNEYQIIVKIKPQND